MIKIGLLSDTHSYIDNAMLDFLMTVDEIWHAGDIGDIQVLNSLRNIKPVKAVYGNIDNNELRQELPKIQCFETEKVKTIITHIGGYPPKYTPEFIKLISKEKPQIFISGHSHILKVIFDQRLKCLHINPGAAGRHGFHNVRTMVRFAIDKNDIKDLEIWEKQR